MICVRLEFDDDPRRLAARPAHRELLESLHDRGDLVTAGPWRDDDGALLVFRCDRARVAEILRDDPYYTSPGVTVAEVREWVPVVGGQV
ncbi:hypothetical protein LX16_4606 [Stackebrandtia albiflava]|uniref:YCII-related domain-containing protein n=1 Tax=Stackebrandtia albiflava TaxID=406432 RepID=A0A562UQE8_9ACTN|nr:YciI family protein [Stackebrandtia albiflava]TWJ07826.1 hypothetical protein LX16_4606 [Stackebrandtia albiflava]